MNRKQRRANTPKKRKSRLFYSDWRNMLRLKQHVNCNGKSYLRDDLFSLGQYRYEMLLEKLNGDIKGKLVLPVV